MNNKKDLNFLTGILIRELREELGLSQESLAKPSGIECNKRNLTIKTLIIITQNQKAFLKKSSKEISKNDKL